MILKTEIYFETSSNYSPTELEFKKRHLEEGILILLGNMYKSNELGNDIVVSKTVRNSTTLSKHLGHRLKDVLLDLTETLREEDLVPITKTQVLEIMRKG